MASTTPLASGVTQAPGARRSSPPRNDPSLVAPEAAFVPGHITLELDLSALRDPAAVPVAESVDSETEDVLGPGHITLELDGRLWA